jgi:CubicO group peptidase (beta-lactamase class C family)
MKRILSVALVVFLSAAATAQKKAADSRLQDIDKELQQVLDTWKAAGFAVAVVEKNKVIYAKGFGFRDYEKKHPVTANTLFAIGSCTKAFTCGLLGNLKEHDKIDFDASPRQYIPGFRFFNDEMNDNIIVKDLMSHRTGLPRHDYSWYLFPTDDRDSLVNRIQYQEPFTGVREKWYYNNFMFLLQGVMVEKITGKSWEDNIREQFFGPLGMSTSNLSIGELEKAGEPSFGYEVSNDQIRKMKYYNIAAMAPAGSINSSVNEMTHWLRTWIYGGKFEGKQIIPSSYARDAISAQAVISDGLPSNEHPDVHGSTYGYGWMLASYKGHYRAEHGGNIDGFSATTSFFPSDSIGIVVLVNQNASVVPTVVRNILSDRMLKVTRTNWNKEFKDRKDKNDKEEAAAGKSKEDNSVNGTKLSHATQDYTGRYEFPGYGKFDIIARNDSLYALFKLQKAWLRHRHYDVFDAFPVKDGKADTANMLDPKLNFQTNDMGEIASVTLKLEPTLDAFTFKRAAPAAALDETALSRYVGSYEVGGMVAKFYIKNKALALTVPGQPEYDLIFVGGDKFLLKNLAGFRIEFVNTAGKYSEAVFVQPNGTFRAKRKD